MGVGAPEGPNVPPDWSLIWMFQSSLISRNLFPPQMQHRTINARVVFVGMSQHTGYLLGNTPARTLQAHPSHFSLLLPVVVTQASSLRTLREMRPPPFKRQDLDGEVYVLVTRRGLITWSQLMSHSKEIIFALVDPKGTRILQDELKSLWLPKISFSGQFPPVSS